MDMSVIEDAHRWLVADPDPQMRVRLSRLIDKARHDPVVMADLADAFSGPLPFGTAGLRGPVGPGPNRMNSVVVARAAAGLAAWLVDNGQAGSRVLIGYDARRDSADFAFVSAEVLSGAGLEVLLMDTPAPTPVAVYGMTSLGCAAGVVVTASHNPAADNGYKVYVGGRLIVPPLDAEIAGHIARLSARPVASLPQSNSVTVVGDELLSDYIEHAAGLIPTDAARDVRWVHTGLHGTATAPMARLTAAAGFPAAAEVASQAEPDPAFPTIAFPNPEEPGAIDEAIELARSIDADVVIAHDPDGDRCAVATVVDGSWRMLTGDEVGWLLAEDALRRGVEGVYACSIVSSTLLADLAAAHHQPFAATLTGFKWIGRVPGLAFGYEEAIGYCTDPAAVPDKDGLTAALRVLELTARLAASGYTLAGRLDDLAQTYGLVATSQLAVRVEDTSLIARTMSDLRADPPTRLLSTPVTVLDRLGATGLPPADAVEFTGSGVHVVVRPSGTEPKLKVYLEVRLPVEQSQVVHTARRVAADRLAELSAELTGILGPIR